MQYLRRVLARTFMCIAMALPMMISIFITMPLWWKWIASSGITRTTAMGITIISACWLYVLAFFESMCRSQTSAWSGIVATLAAILSFMLSLLSLLVLIVVMERIH